MFYICCNTSHKTKENNNKKKKKKTCQQRHTAAVISPPSLSLLGEQRAKKGQRPWRMAMGSRWQEGGEMVWYLMRGGATPERTHTYSGKPFSGVWECNSFGCRQQCKGREHSRVWAEGRWSGLEQVRKSLACAFPHSCLFFSSVPWSCFPSCPLITYTGWHFARLAYTFMRLWQWKSLNSWGPWDERCRCQGVCIYCIPDVNKSI